MNDRCADSMEQACVLRQHWFKIIDASVTIIHFPLLFFVGLFMINSMSHLISGDQPHSSDW